MSLEGWTSTQLHCLVKTKGCYWNTLPWMYTANSEQTRLQHQGTRTSIKTLLQEHPILQLAVCKIPKAYEQDHILNQMFPKIAYSQKKTQTSWEISAIPDLVSTTFGINVQQKNVVSNDYCGVPWHTLESVTACSSVSLCQAWAHIRPASDRGWLKSWSFPPLHFTKCSAKAWPQL